MPRYEAEITYNDHVTDLVSFDTALQLAHILKGKLDQNLEVWAKIQDKRVPKKQKKSKI